MQVKTSSPAIQSVMTKYHRSDSLSPEGRDSILNLFAGGLLSQEVEGSVCIPDTFTLGKSMLQIKIEHKD